MCQASIESAIEMTVGCGDVGCSRLTGAMTSWRRKYRTGSGRPRTGSGRDGGVVSSANGAPGRGVWPNIRHSTSGRMSMCAAASTACQPGRS